MWILPRNRRSLPVVILHIAVSESTSIRDFFIASCGFYPPDDLVPFPKVRISNAKWLEEIMTNEEIEETDINEMRSIDDESRDGQSTTFDNDVDSEVSFEDDADEKKKTGLNTQREA